MSIRSIKWVLASALSMANIVAFAQELPNIGGGVLRGNFVLDAQYYRPDSTIGAEKVDERMRFMGAANLIYTKGKFTAGLRFESYEKALLGIDQGFNDGAGRSGVPYRFVTYADEDLEITVGNYYEQFGNGLTLRVFEDRNLGIDNSLDGARVRYNPLKGVYLKGLFGRQRIYWGQGPGIVRGGDAEFGIHDWLPQLSERGFIVFLGGSFVSRFQSDNDPSFNLPLNVGVGAGRISIQKGGFLLSGEYARKNNDPSGTNKNIYNIGEVLLLQASYSTKGLGIAAGFKSADNMEFRSDRGAQDPNVLFINFLPALVKQHTYNLAASIYPYAVQPLGEIGGQFELTYKFEKGSIFGGRYGTDVAANFSAVNTPKRTTIDSVQADITKVPYSNTLFGIGNGVIFRDYNLEVRKKLSKKSKVNLMYMYTENDTRLTLGDALGTLVQAHIGVVDYTYKLNDSHTIRTELQALTTSQDQGSWASALIEYSISPHWFFSILDQYNYGNPNENRREHYILTGAGYTKEGMRLQVFYGRQRQGILCVGGICRVVPATNGVTLQLSKTF